MSNVVLIFAVIIVLATLGVVMVCYKCSDKFTNLSKLKENFSPVGWTRNCPPPSPPALLPSTAYGPMTGPLNAMYRKFGVRSDGKNVVGSLSPGAVFKCKDREKCPPLSVKGCNREEPSPVVRENMPLGWGGTMSGPYAGMSGCASNVNGITKMSYDNPYGATTPYGDQMYGMCVKGESNPFDNQPYKTIF